MRRFAPITRQSAEARGEVTTQVVVILPVLLLVLFTVVHLAIASHLGHVAAAAAQAGVRTATVAQGDGGALEVTQAVEEAMRDLNGSLRSPPLIVRTRNHVIVTVEAKVPSLVPFLPDHVSRSAVASIERFRTEGER